jgi:deoxyribodipyrimidine photo-lyase
MRHLIDGDCPIDHYQWAMQSGVTHCVDKTWTRIYNPGQVAVDRCDPQGDFIKHWVPELSHLPPHQLGNPPPTKGYPTPILDYKAVRQRRVEQLQNQRGKFLSTSNILPHIARLPEDMTPFGTDLYGGETAWANQRLPDLFPAPLALDNLDAAQARSLRTWFVAHVNVVPPKTRKRSIQRTNSDPNVQQLNLLEEPC